MKFRYDKKDDAMMIWFSRAKVDYAEKSKNVIIHFSKNDKPVLMEILEASAFLKKASHKLPPEVQHSFFASI